MKIEVSDDYFLGLSSCTFRQKQKLTTVVDITEIDHFFGCLRWKKDLQHDLPVNSDVRHSEFSLPSLAPELIQHIGSEVSFLKRNTLSTRSISPP